MSLRIQQLNADTTFLLTFSPPFAPERPAKRFPGDFTILIDPWLSGHSSILHPRFQISHHISEPVITSLKDLKPKPDLIIVSQDKPDHCHKETLCSLPKRSCINLLATPAAAKKIRSWKHFDAGQVHVMEAYSASNADSIIRIPLPSYSSSSAKGEITIANMPTKADMTKLHNAIGITYQPPSSILTRNTQHSRHEAGSTVVLSEYGISNSYTSPQRPRTASSTARPAFLDPLRTTSSHPNLSGLAKPLSRPPSRADSGIVHASSARSNYEKTLSVIYTPHGVQPQVLDSYIANYLRPLSALPVSALFHSINVEENPWFMGGLVAAGAPGGLKIAANVETKHWISAHDEVKDNKGIATVWIKSRQYEVDEVQSMLREAGAGDTKVHKLGVGEVLRIPELMESNNSSKLGGEK